jgi:hypothetical protein
MKTKERSAQEVKDEIAAILACKAYAPHYTFFGDDNWRKMGLQAEALNGDIDTTCDEFLEQYTDDEQSEIIAAIEWRDGERDEKPSAGWDDRKPKTKKSALKRQKRK